MLITPLATENVLEGITRDSMMELAQRELGFEVVERPVDRSELYMCDELFLTGTAVGVAPVVRVDHRPVADGAIGPVTRRLAAVVLRRDARTSAGVSQVAAAGLWQRPIADAERAAPVRNERRLSQRPSIASRVYNPS